MSAGDRLQRLLRFISMNEGDYFKKDMQRIITITEAPVFSILDTKYTQKF
jgi:hypothetical protein